MVIMLVFVVVMGCEWSQWWWSRWCVVLIVVEIGVLGVVWAVGDSHDGSIILCHEESDDDNEKNHYYGFEEGDECDDDNGCIVFCF